MLVRSGDWDLMEEDCITAVSGNSVWMLVDELLRTWICSMTRDMPEGRMRGLIIIVAVCWLMEGYVPVIFSRAV